MLLWAKVGCFNPAEDNIEAKQAERLVYAQLMEVSRLDGIIMILI